MEVLGVKPKAWTHPKFAVLQKMLGTSKALTAGILEGLWHLTATFDSKSGRMPHSGSELAAWLEVPIDGETLIDALVDSRWLDNVDGVYVIHDWQEHKPSYIKEAERKSRQRQNVPGQSWDSHGTVRDIPGAADHSDSDSVSDKESSPNGDDIHGHRRSASYSEAFEAWWQHYPRKVQKLAAAKAYRSACQRADADVILRATMAFAVTPKAIGDYCPYPATWLNESRWEDDPKEWQRSGSSGNGARKGSRVNAALEAMKNANGN